MNVLTILGYFVRQIIYPGQHTSSGMGLAVSMAVNALINKGGRLFQ